MSESMYGKLSQERKELQAKGLVPEWMTTAGWQLFKGKYLYDTDEAVYGQYKRIAKAAAVHLEGTPFHEAAEEKFFDLFWKGWLSPSTPVLANMGTNRGLPVACSGGYIEDSIDGFYSARHETASLTKYGFGTSGYLGDVRPRGSNISVGGKASGVVPVFKGFVQDMRDVAQGTARRGAWAGYLPIDHADFDELADFVMAEPDDANVGWIVTQEFIDKLEAQDPDSIRRFQKSLKMKMITGRGYYFKVDTANKLRPAKYKELGLDVKASNLCVAPETLILTDSGYRKISSLEGESVAVWNGSEWSDVEVRKTGESQALVRVVTNSGFELECTPYHKFYVKNDYYQDAVEKRANELVAGDKLIKLETPVIKGYRHLHNAYIQGFYSGDGCDIGTRQLVYLYHDKRELLDLFINTGAHTSFCVQDSSKRVCVYYKHLKPKAYVPSATITDKDRLQWFAGLLDSDGCLTSNSGTQSLQVTSVDKQFLKETQLMLQTLGVQSKVVKGKPAGVYHLPANDGTGMTKEYSCKESYRLLVGEGGVQHLLNIGLVTHRLDIKRRTPDRDATRFVTVEAVIDEGRVDDTYCFNEPLKHMGVFNGLLTGQCAEISLHSSEDYTFTCVLSSMNLAKWDEWKNTDAVYWATIFLDCVATEFVGKAEKIPALKKAVEFTKKGRALGLGACGFHTYLQEHKIPFDSLEASFFNNTAFEHISIVATTASEDLCKVFGQTEWADKGMRNSHLTAIAPTKSTALIMGGVSEGINPDPALAYTQLTAGGEMNRVNPILLKLMREKGIYNKKHIQEVVDANGSVQGVDWLTEEEKSYLKTAFEINQETVVRYAAQRQKYVSQSQSLNLFFAADEDAAWISHIHRAAFMNPNIISLYYITTMSGVQASKDCESCQ